MSQNNRDTKCMLIKDVGYLREKKLDKWKKHLPRHICSALSAAQRLCYFFWPSHSDKQQQDMQRAHIYHKLLIFKSLRPSQLAAAVRFLHSFFTAVSPSFSERSARLDCGRGRAHGFNAFPLDSFLQYKRGFFLNLYDFSMITASWLSQSICTVVVAKVVNESVFCPL